MPEHSFVKYCQYHEGNLNELTTNPGLLWCSVLSLGEWFWKFWRIMVPQYFKIWFSQNTTNFIVNHKCGDMFRLRVNIRPIFL